MKRKSIISLTLNTIIIFSIAFTGCSNTARNRNDFTKNNATDGTNPGTTNEIKDNINNMSDSTKNNIKSAKDSVKYGAENLKNDIINAGYKLKELLNIKSDYFKGAETDYQLGRDKVRLYEYNTTKELEDDIGRISNDGLTVKGTNVGYNSNNKPYYYKKGNSLIVYEGKDPVFLNELKRLFGDTLRP